MAPQKLKLDEKLIKDLASIHCTMEEIAAMCHCSVDTLERRYAEIIKKGKEEGKSSLRRLQWKSAKGGSIPMQIWLGKQMLNQRDRSEQEVAGAHTFVISGVRTSGSDPS